MFSITGLVIACLIYHNAHGLPDTQIVGTYATGSHYPFQASLMYISDSNVKAYLCGGAIVSRNYVITAAHCLNRLPSLFKLVVDVGEGSSSATHAINAIIIHPHYIPTMLYIYDIGLINLKEPISFNLYSKINLISYDRDFENVDFIAIGWNTLNRLKVSIRSNLQQTSGLNVTGVSQTTCGEKYDKYITHLHICTQNMYPNSICNGDAGGLLIFNSSLVGIMSSNGIMPCRDYPDVYTRVYFYQSWINKIINARL